MSRPPSPHALRARRRGRWRAWIPPVLAVALVAALLCLAAANVVRAGWNELVDGVLWADRPAGVTAVEVAPGEAGDRAGIEAGDVLVALDGVLVESTRDAVAHLHARQRAGHVAYTLLRFDQSRLIDVTLQPAPAQTQIYVVLAGIGVFTLLLGASVRLRRPGTECTLHFFWLCAAFFGMFAFSFTGRLDRLDWVFYWADAIATLALAPLFVHFALVFPERAPGAIRNRLGRLVMPIVYAPAVVAGLLQAMALAIDAGSALFTTAIERVWRFELAYLAVCVAGGLALMILTLRRVPSVTSKRQLRWIVWGAVLGGLPFVFGYAAPWSLGFDPVPLDVTAIPLSLIPLAFALAIVQYRLRDVEVIVKRGLVYTAAAAAMVAIYFVMEQLARAMFLDEPDGHSSVIALLATAVVVLLARPVKDAIESMLDRAHYRDRYDYRRALLGFARELNRDLDLDRLAERLVARVTETLVVDHTVLMVAPLESEAGPFRPVRATGARPVAEWPGLDPASGIGGRAAGQGTILLDDAVAAFRYPQAEVEFWRDLGIHYFVPCVSKEGTIAVLALGAKTSGEPLSSEDLALLAAVAAQVATAIENGRLYAQLQVKAAEVDRIREFNENIIESLNDGLVVLDLEDRVVRWNAALARVYGVERGAAVGRPLATLFDRRFTDRLARERRDHAAGSTLYRVPLTSRHAGEPRELLVNAAQAPLLTPGGDTAGTMILLEDITERVRLEEQLQISERMASVGLLAAGVAHEVNTPLTGISSFTQMLIEGAAPDDSRLPLLKKIERQVVRAARIVNGLLNLSRPGQSGAAGPVDVNGVMNDVLVLVEHQLRTSNIRVRRELSPTPTVVQGVESRLQQVFLNLILNARDAMPTGGWLSIGSRNEGDRAVIEVADTGAGIASEDLSRIYDPFFTTKAVGQGTGLGLSIVYGVVQEHRGAIDCRTGAGGTRFTVTLPVSAHLRSQSAG